jgi:CRISPR-associated protein Cas1
MNIISLYVSSALTLYGVCGLVDDENSLKDEANLIPARMLNEFAYCPRLCYIEWIEGDFADSADTVDGRFQHRRVDSKEDDAREDDFGTVHARSVSLSGPKAGITCRIDLLEGDGQRVTPVEYKRGDAPRIPEGAYEPDRVQLCAQCLVLRENGFDCQEGVVYFAGSRKRVRVDFDRELIKRTQELISSLRTVADKRQVPPPLQDSPKCNRCSLAGICLPDEVNLLKEMEGKRDSDGLMGKIRKLLPARDDALPVYVVGHGHTVKKKGDVLEIWGKDGKVSEARLREISQVNLYGNVEVTAPTMAELMQRGVPILHFTHGGWFQGVSLGHTHKNIGLRMKQFSWAGDRKRSLSLARCFVSGKIRNCRTLVRRNDLDGSEKVLESLARLSRDAENASSLEKLLGIEGAAAEAYFSCLDGMLKNTQGFSFQNRNRRPPKDPVNAVLSYLYGILAKDLFSTLLAVGFDPYLGFYHQPRYGRPALALDMMEEFRPLIADSTAVTLFNNKELTEKDFIKTGIGVSLRYEAKKKVVGGYERRIQTEITHPIFGYKVSYRRVLEVQARLLSRVLSGELKAYPAFVTR